MKFEFGEGSVVKSINGLRILSTSQIMLNHITKNLKAVISYHTEHYHILMVG
jgi:hypothetical protein